MAQFFTSAEGIATLIVWVVVIVRFIVAVRRGRIGQALPQNRQVWLLWLACFCIALSTTGHHPIVQQFVAEEIGEWFSTIPQVCFAIAACVLVVQVCYEFAPHLRPRRNWPLYLGLLIMGVNAFIDWALFQNVSSQSISIQRLPPDIFFNFFLILLITRFGLPAFVWARQHEKQKPMRLRFLIMLMLHLAIVLWMLTGIIDDFVLVVGLSFNSKPIYDFLAIFGATTFAMSYLIPMGFYVRLAQAGDYPFALQAVILARVVESNAAYWVREEPIPLEIVDSVRSPTDSIYEMVIAIFDRRKSLKVCASPGGRRLGLMLDDIARPELEYPEIVVQLCRIGLSLIWFRLRTIGVK